VNRFLACLLLVTLAACGGGDGGSQTVTGPTEITVEEITVGNGATAAVGDVVTVHYTLFLANGTRIESSYDTGQPLPPFQIGGGRVIPGFERGVLGMRVGGKRRVTVPPSLGYGAQQNGSIPPNSTLRFEIELVSIAGK
jgi:FKBP-type peptidyl-prolyl cis-trans isomerase